VCNCDKGAYGTYLVFRDGPCVVDACMVQQRWKQLSPEHGTSMCKRVDAVGKSAHVDAKETAGLFDRQVYNRHA